MKKYAVLRDKRSFKEHFFGGVITLFLLAFCVWVSKGSTFWTMITGMIFSFYVLVKFSIFIGSNNNEFDTKRDLQNWVDKLEE